jgi:hypothetical protein
MVVEHYIKLTHINLEGNNMGDVSIGLLCDMINYVATVQVLNVSKNELTCVGAQHLARAIECEDNRIRSIILHWNLIKGPGS